MSNENLSTQPKQQRWLSNTLWAIKTCIPYFFEQEEEKEGGVSWSWISQISQLRAHVRPDTSRGTISIFVRDTKTDKTIRLWSSKVNMTGAWRNRLRQAVGEAFILAQYRHKCPKCRRDTNLCERHDNGEQYFRCCAHPECDGIINLSDHDIERNEAVCVNARTANARY